MTLDIYTPTPEPWMQDAPCSEVDPEIFFPSIGAAVPIQVAHAVSICESCDVRLKCLAYALEHDERFGIWAGTTPKQRAKMRRAVS